MSLLVNIVKLFDRVFVFILCDMVKIGLLVGILSMLVWSR